VASDRFELPAPDALPPAPRLTKRSLAHRPSAWSFVGAAAATAAVTAIGMIAYRYVAMADLAMLYLIAIMLASFPGRGPSLLAASLAVAAFDFCFVPPRFTFAVADVRYLLTFGVMFGCGLVISTLTVRLRRQEHDAVGRERRTAALLAFTREVSTATDQAEVAVVATRHLEDGLDAAAAVLVPDGERGLVAAAGLMPLADREAGVARWAFEHRRMAGAGTDTVPDARVLAIPLVDGEHAVGVIALQRRKAAPLEAAQVHLLDALARQTTAALGRVWLAAQAREAALRARTEELRSSLLSAVSHDLRTPLAVITGAATSLRDDGARMDTEARADLLSSIIDDARRLERVLANLLQLTRVETGFEPAREWVPADEFVGAALTRLEGTLQAISVEVDVQPELLLWIDPVLFEQLLINLLENALKHAQPPLSIQVRDGAQAITLEVSDRGPGLVEPTGRLFEKHVRASPAPGAGLGLAVVRAIVVAHGGSVAAENRPGGGAVFRVQLPQGSAPPNALGGDDVPA
jgi:two-component system, OmpR family, sensor histidine kinase KdpD